MWQKLMAYLQSLWLQKHDMLVNLLLSELDNLKPQLSDLIAREVDPKVMADKVVETIKSVIKSKLGA